MDYPYYHQHIDRVEAEKRLRHVGHDGSFLVRDSGSNQGVYVLCLLLKMTVFQYRIIEDLNGRMYFEATKDQPDQARLPLGELIELYLSRGGRNGLKTALVHGVKPLKRLPQYAFVMDYPYYHQHIDRVEAKKRLRHVGHDGSFLVRDSGSNQGVYVLCLLLKMTVFQYRILKDKNGRMYIESTTNQARRSSMSLEELTEQYLLRGGHNGLKTALVHGVRPDGVESSDHDSVLQAKDLMRECSICWEEFQLEQLASLCCHDTAKDGYIGSICIDCARLNFEQCIQQEGVSAFACPLRCGAPKDVENDREEAEEYFTNLLAVTFHNINLDRKYIQRFEQRLSIWRLSKDPQFFWCENPKPCSEESYGFIYEGDGPCIVCPKCQYSRCRDCKEEWKSEHIGKTCKEFAFWKRENSAEFQKGEAKNKDYLEIHGISCPQCKEIFHHARGGCMDYRCPECNFQFCSGCGLHIYKGKTCPRHSKLNCGAKGLHCHHPRNCNYYMRDRETADLEELLDSADVEFRGPDHGGCTLKLEDDNGETMVCQKEEFAKGLCEKHYKENLVVLINTNMIEVLPIMTIELMEGQLVDNQVTFHKEPHTAAYRQNLEKRIISSLPIMDLSAYRNF